MARIAAATLTAASIISVPTAVDGGSAPTPKNIGSIFSSGFEIPTTTTTAPQIHAAPEVVDPIGLTGDLEALGAPADVAQRFACIVQHESGFDATAVNASSGSAGLFQFMPATWQSLGHAGTASDYSVADQVAAAWALFQRSGWQPWTGNVCLG